MFTAAETALRRLDRRTTADTTDLEDHRSSQVLDEGASRVATTPMDLASLLKNATNRGQCYAVMIAGLLFIAASQAALLGAFGDRVATRLTFQEYLISVVLGGVFVLLGVGARVFGMLRLISYIAQAKSFGQQRAAAAAEWEIQDRLATAFREARERLAAVDRALATASDGDVGDRAAKPDSPA